MSAEPVLEKEGLGASPVQELKESKDRLFDLFSKEDLSPGFQTDYTEIVDHYFRRSLQESRAGHTLFRDKKPFAFVPVGGYGRKDLSIHSDIDIMILFDSKIPPEAKALTEGILYPLWDLGFDLGHGVRTIKDCLSLCRDEFEVLTSILDARFLCGDSPLYLKLMEKLQSRVVSRQRKAFARWLEDRHKIRMDTVGDASYLLEPDLKEGIGGLRDYHHILWLAKAFLHLRVPRELETIGTLSHREYRDLRDHQQFITLVRNHLHMLSGRRNDRLIFEYQEEIARKLGFREKNDVLAVEQFLGQLHASMATLKSIHYSFVKNHIPKKQRNGKATPVTIPGKSLLRYRDELAFNSSTAILSNPHLLMNIFEESARSGHHLTQEAKRLVGEFLYLVDDDFRASQGVYEGFLKIINAPYTSEALEQMYETGFLGAFIPEFEKIKDRVQFDAYHIFPVGRHILQTVKNLKKPATEKDLLLIDIFSEISNPETLFLAGLFHDIGKTGKNHSVRGAKITGRILKRLGLGEKAGGEILFLVRRHLLLAETATKRDLKDEKVIVQCAREIGDIDRLKMLYLLTWADSRATGPRAWNDWIANLVQELFFKILHTLERGELATPRASNRDKRTLSQVRRKMEGRMKAQDLEDLFEVMSPRYLLETPPHDMERHIGLYSDLQIKKKDDPEDLVFELEAMEAASEGCWELTFLAKDRPGLFSDMTGVLALNNINTLSAHIYTWQDGTAVDIFKVTRPLDALHSDEVWMKVSRDLKDVLSGNLSLIDRLDQKSKPSILSTARKPLRPPTVGVDNTSSDFFTLIEVIADDATGLLHRITLTLFTLGLDIRIAKIATKGDQIADIFYVRDLEGQKAEDKGRVHEIKSTLLHQLG